MTATDTHLLLRAFVDELARCGVSAACTSPGSRSAPLVLALVREPRIRCFSHIDERCAGFFALGLAKAARRPVVIACTSGTAAAELAPAVIEAHEARVPLVVLTADRPPELRDVGAGQTIDQLKLYGTAAKWFFEVGTHESGPERLRWIRTLACRACWTAVQGRPGPVHLNFPLREPLVLDEPLAAAAGGRPGGAPWVGRRGGASGPANTEVDALAGALADHPRGVIVAGRHEGDPALPGTLDRLARALGYPLLADPLSGARRGAAAIAHYDDLLRHDAFAAGHAPTLVLRLGDLPTSRPLREWLAALDPDVRQIAVDPEGAWQDPAGAVAQVIEREPVALLDPLIARLAGAEPAEPDWLAGWVAGARAAGGAIGGGGGGGLSEPRVAAELGSSLPAQATLFVASSMPVRDVESFWPVRDGAGPRLLANRGANGIDGTVSSALGAAVTTAGPTVLLTGDVALAYDLGGLLAASRLGVKATIVVLNNDGGGIFHFLPISGEGDLFEEHVATPHGLDFGVAAALYGCGHERVEDLGGFRSALERALGAERTTIVEVRTDRAANVALHRDVHDAVARALEGGAGLSRPAPAAAPRA